MQKYTAKEFSEVLNISVPAVWKKVNKLLNDQEGRKIKQIYVESETVNNRDMKVIYIDEGMLDELIATSGLQKPKTDSNKPINETGNQYQEPVINNDFVKELINELIQSKNQLINYSKEVGKTELLTDNLMTREKDAKHWQDEYFKVKYEFDKLQEMVNNLQEQIATFNNSGIIGEVETLKKQVANLQTENRQLKTDLESERKRPFWKRNVL